MIDEQNILEDIAYCNKVIRRANISITDAATYKKMKKENIEKLIEEKHHYSISYNVKHGLYVTRIRTTDLNGKVALTKISAVSMQKLNEKLFEHYYGINTFTINNLYPLMLQTKTQKGLQCTSVKRYNAQFHKYIEPTDLGKKKITDITGEDLAIFFGSYSEKVTRHVIGNVKSIINAIYDYAIAHNIVTINIADQFNTRMIKTQAERDDPNDVYSDIDRQKIMAALRDSNDIYDQSIVLMFCLGCRDGEVLAFHYEDIDASSKRILIHREIVERIDEAGHKHFVEVQHTKTGHDSGVRSPGLSTTALDAIRKAMEITKTDTGYIFKGKTGNFLYAQRMREHMKAVCNNVGVTYRPPHKMRFWAVSHMIANGYSIAAVQSVTGQSKQTVMHYQRLVQDNTLSEADINALFG